MNAVHLKMKRFFCDRCDFKCYHLRDFQRHEASNHEIPKTPKKLPSDTISMIPQTPKTPKIPKIPRTPKTPRIRNVPMTPKTPKVPKVSFNAKTPKVPKTPKLLKAHQHQGYIVFEDIQKKLYFLQHKKLK